jgi:NADPH:quinone reductase-like Zn-dependent oxidoreductase
MPIGAAYIDALGDASAVRYGELPDPVAGTGQVLVRVDAVAVNHVDAFLRSGRWRSPVSFPLVLGRDLVGAVAAVGAGVTDVQPGQRVWTNSAGYAGRPGATAERVVVDRDRLYPLPAGADPVAFVAAVHPGATAHGVLVGRARLRAGETVAVVGANGAVGMCLVQVAAACGAEVVAVVREGRAGDRLRRLGAHRVVVAEGVEVPATLDGADVVVDASARADLTGVEERLNPRGRAVLVAGRGNLQLDMWRLYTREIQILGFVMSAMTVPELAAAARWINESHSRRPLSVEVGMVAGFADAADAHATVESGRLPHSAEGIVGRIVLRP